MRQRRKTAGLLAAVILAVSIVSPVMAAAPRVQVDETMYVNLDYYGKTTTVNVVKGCSTNGLAGYTDYGTYEKVVNMTNKTEPAIGDGMVTWQLPEGNNRFYYQCTMPEGSVELPWSFDVSYKLNGVEADASKLAGAAGLVEINVKADPNQNARAYYRNNMMLTVVVPVDMEKCYSVDAPGAQIQSLGNNTIAMFAALPGEDGDFTIRIGTDDFESVGVIMLMVPGTLDALDNIKDLKEAKDTWREDGNKMYDSMTELLKSMESMKTDVTRVQGGLNSLDQARSQVSGNRKQIEALSTQALAELSSVTEQTSKLIPYLETARNAVTDINANVDAIYNTMEDMQDELDRLYDRLGSLKNALNHLADGVGSGITKEEQQALAAGIKEQTDEIQGILDSLGGQLGAGGTSYELTKEELKDLEDSLESADSFRYKRGRRAERASASELEEDSDITSFGEEEDGVLLRRGPSGLLGTGGVDDTDFEEWSDEIDPYADEVEEMLQSLSSTSYPEEVGALLDQIQDMIGDGTDIQQSAAQIIGKINTVCGEVGNTSAKTASTVSALRLVTDELINLLDDSRVLIDTTDRYVPSMLDSLSDTEELMNRLTRAMGSTHDMLSLVNTTMIAAGDSFDAGTKDSLQGLGELLGKSLGTLDAITSVREAGEGMKGTIDEQLDKFEDENNFLNMDPEADMISFTSSKNPSPHSLQIMLRTDEISDDDDVTDISDMEDSDNEDMGPFQRMWNVIVKIFRSIVEIFKNR